MIADDVCTYALARLTELGASAPVARSLMYRQIGVRQQQLYARAARVNPDWAGVCATAALDQGAADLSDIAPPIETPERIQRIEIADPGTSNYAAGDEVHPVPLQDQVYAALPPRVTVRNRVIRGVGADLDGVISLRVSYARVPLALGPSDGARVLDLPEPHAELLVVDLARYLVRKSTTLAPDARAAAVEALTAEEATLLLEFDAYVHGYVGPLTSRFAIPVPRAEGREA